jgi:hypothetical protein
MKIRKGDFYIDCGNHPCLCTESDGDDLTGISLVDGSIPRCCSVRACRPRKITALGAIRIRLHGPTGRRRLHAEHPEIIKMCGQPWWMRLQAQWAGCSTALGKDLT